MDDHQDDSSNPVLGFEICTEPSVEEDVFVPRYDNLGSYKLTADNKKTQVERQKWSQGPANFRNSFNQQPFQQNRQGRFKRKFQRYHLDGEQKYGHFRPGVISDRLRRALGLHKNELPQHIYQMRVLGYPPGWLEEAKVVHSGLTVFDAQGNTVKERDEDEDGELIDYEKMSKYDINKLVEYPGFNVFPDSRVKDEWEHYGSVPMLERHSLDHMIGVLMPNAAQAYKRRKMSSLPFSSQLDSTQTSTRSESEAAVDMDCEETPATTFLPPDNCKFVPPLPDEDDKPPPPPPDEDVPPSSPKQPPDEETSRPSTSEDASQPAIKISTLEASNISNDAGNDDSHSSLSLSDLEVRKKELMEQLHDTNSSSNSHMETATTTPTVDRIRKSDTNTPSPSHGRTVMVDLGTPVLKSFSPFSKLPSSECFSQNICDVINFENLPDSTGVYDRMVGVINKVRQTVKRLQQED